VTTDMPGLTQFK